MPGKSKPPVLEELSRAYPRLTAPQQRVAGYILKHPEKVREASVEALCRATEASEPVLFAVCRAAGRKGYRALKLDLAGELAVLHERRRAAGGPAVDDVELNGNETPESLARKIGAVYCESISATVAGLDARAFSRAVEALGRAAGRKGYRALKLDLAGELAVLHERRRAAGGLLSADDVELNGNETPESLARKIGAVYCESISATVAGLDARAFSRAVEALGRARRAVVFGMGISGHIAQIAQYALVRAGVAATCSTDSYVQLAHLAALGKGDVAVALSYMGEQPEMSEGLRLARSRGASTIAVTGQRKSPLAAEADLVLELPPRPPLASYVSVGARVAAAELLLVDALAAAVALDRRAEFDERAAAVREVVEARKARKRKPRRKKENAK